MTLKNFLMIAYDVKHYQVDGPAWIETERYDIAATMAPDTSMERFRLMLQNLLTDRFKISLHRESRVMPIFALSVAKGGPKLKVSPPSSASGILPQTSKGSNPKMGPDGPVHLIPLRYLHPCS